MSPESGDKLPLDTYSSAIKCKPIKAHAFSVSAIKKPEFHRSEEKELAMRPVLLQNIAERWLSCAMPQHPKDPNTATLLPSKALPTSSAKPLHKPHWPPSKKTETQTKGLCDSDI